MVGSWRLSVGAAAKLPDQAFSRPAAASLRGDAITTMPKHSGWKLAVATRQMIHQSFMFPRAASFGFLLETLFHGEPSFRFAGANQSVCSCDRILRIRQATAERPATRTSNRSNSRPPPAGRMDCHSRHRAPSCSSSKGRHDRIRRIPRICTRLDPHRFFLPLRFPRKRAASCRNDTLLQVFALGSF